MADSIVVPLDPAAAAAAAAKSPSMAPTAIRIDDEPPEASPSWFTPMRLLIIFSIINMLNYIDRGVIASNGVNGSHGIQGSFHLSNFKDGLLSSSFMVGLLVACPIFASMARTHNPFRLIGVGLSVWTLATAGCGLSFDFWSITICRMLVGVGEASFISLAAPFIDDNAPPAHKTSWLAMFYLCIPTGIALGYVYGGLVGNHLRWRYAFFGESILMLPFAVLAFLITPLGLQGFATDDNNRGGLARLWDDMKLLINRVFVVNVLGYVAYNFVIGAYSYWGPKAGYAIYHMGQADMVFGGVTIVCGILGTLAGGFVLDKMGSTISNAFVLLSVATFLGSLCCFAAFCLKSLYGFVALFSIGELLVFATQAPVNYVCLRCVEPSLRPLAMAVSTVAIHVFGDVPSSPLVGVLQDHVNNWRETALILTSVLFVAAGVWCVGVFLGGVGGRREPEQAAPSV